MIEIRRYYNIDESYRTCVYCDAYVEDVYYFVLICPLYKNLRDKFLPYYYTNNPSTQSYCRPLSCENVTFFQSTTIRLNIVGYAISNGAQGEKIKGV